MKYGDFEKFIREKCMYETIYDDSDGRQTLVIKMLDAYGMVNKAQREWQGLTETEKEMMWDEAVEGREHFCSQYGDFADAIEGKLKEKNG